LKGGEPLRRLNGQMDGRKLIWLGRRLYYYERGECGTVWLGKLGSNG